MPWTSAMPSDRWTPREIFAFLREVFTRQKAAFFTWNAPSVGANATVDTTLTTSTIPQLRGLRLEMAVHVTPPSSIDAGLTWGAWVPADDQLTIRLVNTTASPIDPASGTWAFMGVLP